MLQQSGSITMRLLLSSILAELWLWSFTSPKRTVIIWPFVDDSLQPNHSITSKDMVVSLDFV